VPNLKPDRFQINKNLNISRILTGLWQVADIEKDGDTIDPETGADELEAYASDGFSTFDMADHYGSAELIAGTLLKRFSENERPLAFTKWCPAPGPMTAQVVRKGVQDRLDRLGVKKVDLLQFHWWSFEHPAWLDALHELKALREEGLVGEIGLTNFDAAHLHVALADGIPVCTNQVSFSLIDRRGAQSLADVCKAHGVYLLAYGTLCGGFLSDKWLGQKEPETIPDWSGMKYKRFIDVTGGWKAYQGILAAASQIGKKYGVSISNIATRWVLEKQHVAGVIIGARIGQREHRSDNLKLFSFSLDKDDHALLNEAFAKTKMVPGDCGDEYRNPPFLTASGDLTDHLSTIQKSFEAVELKGRKNAAHVLSGNKWEDIAGYCRAKRIGNRVLVSGTTATAGADRVVAAGDAAAQTTFILDKIAGAISALGAKVEDIARTRVYLQNQQDALAVARAHGRVFEDIKPANTLFEVGGLIGDYLVEIDAEAIID
jgi:aryl-alcohol dehydrogenase-like predicted oxidoreductase/enamine deaminase RidA (YjgF/YER057c/UK114 family)